MMRPLTALSLASASPSTSIMEYSPGALPRPHRAALTAPRAKMPRSVARWVSSICSPSAAKITECSPTLLPPRSVAKPMSPRRRGPVWPSRTRTLTLSSFTPRPSAAALPSISAVPEGASTLWR